MVPRVQHVMSSTRSPKAQLVADEVQAAKITKSSPVDTRSVSQSVTPFRPSIAISFLQTWPPGSRASWQDIPPPARHEEHGGARSVQYPPPRACKYLVSIHLLWRAGLLAS